MLQVLKQSLRKYPVSRPSAASTVGIKSNWILNSVEQRQLRLFHVSISALKVSDGVNSEQSAKTSQSSATSDRFANDSGKNKHSSDKGSKKSLFVKTAYYSIFAIGGTVSVIATVLAAFFIYDATTYVEYEPEQISVSSLALNPVVGGPKNLPICYSYLDSNDDSESEQIQQKPRLVILGTGWGSVSLLKELDPDLYNITIISPTNYFLFTPLLPSATVGTLEFRSLMEPIRRIAARLHAHFLEGSACQVEFSDKLVEVKSRDKDSNKEYSFYVPYDKLIVAVGCTTNTHGVNGLQYCHFLKSVQDARSMRHKIVSNLEKACLPTTTNEERKRLLSFVICGGGPTGVELAAEIYDLLNEDLIHNYPKIIRNEISVHVIQSREHILNTYDEKISDYAIRRFQKDNIDVLVNSRVKEVKEDRVLFTTVDTKEGQPITEELPFGMCVWSTGVSLCPLTKKICDTLGHDSQSNRHAIETDSHLRVIGAPPGEVYAIGDCSTVRTDLSQKAADILKESILKHKRYSLTSEDIISEEEFNKLYITESELHELVQTIVAKYPQTKGHFGKLKDLFDRYDLDRSGTLTMDELHKMFDEIQKSVTSLPATAQRASQQGIYLGRKFNTLAHGDPNQGPDQVLSGDIDDKWYKPFVYRHLGSLAYVSNAAVFDLNGKSYFGGLVAMYLWRSVYFAQTVSFRIRVLLFMDWLKRGLFGRDLADISQDRLDQIDR